MPLQFSPGDPSAPDPILGREIIPAADINCGRGRRGRPGAGAPVMFAGRAGMLRAKIMAAGALNPPEHKSINFLIFIIFCGLIYITLS